MLPRARVRGPVRPVVRLRVEKEERKEESSQIRWSDQEKEEVAQRTFELLMRKPQLSLLKAVKRVIAQLPAERQRVIISLNAAPWLLEKVVVRCNAYSEAVKERDQLRAKIAEQDKTIELLRSDIKTYEELQPTVAESLAKAKREDLIGALVPMLLNPHSDTLQAINNRLQSIEQQLVSKNVAPSVTAVAKPKPVKFLLIGIRDKDVQTLRQHLLTVSGQYEFTHIPADHEGREMPTKVDWVILWRKFIGHAHQYRAYAQFAPEIVIRSDATSLSSLAEEMIKKIKCRPT